MNVNHSSGWLFSFYRDVLNIIHESFDAIPITQNYILQLHKILYSHMNNPLAGRTKNVQNYISATYPDGHVETLQKKKIVPYNIRNEHLSQLGIMPPSIVVHQMNIRPSKK